MPVKNKHRKQIVVAYDKSSSAVPIQLHACEDVLGVQSMVESLRSAQSLEQQNKLIQQHKGNMRVAMMGGRGVIGQSSLDIECLVILYLLPSSFPLRKELEWLPETLARTTCCSADGLQGAVRRACLHISSTSAPLLSTVFDDGADLQQQLGSALGLVFSFSAMAVLDKEVAWISDGSLLFNYISPLQMFASRCAEAVCSDSQVSSLELIRYTECCGEALRGVMIALKTRRELSLCVEAGGADAVWASVLDIGIASGLKLLLQAERHHKDLVTTQAMTVVSYLWLLRGDGSRDGSLQPSELLALLLGKLGVPGSTIGSAPSSCRLHPSLERAAQGGLPPLAKATLLRAALSVFPADAFASSSSSSAPSHTNPLSGAFEALKELAGEGEREEEETTAKSTAGVGAGAAARWAATSRHESHLHATATGSSPRSWLGW